MLDLWQQLRAVYRDAWPTGLSVLSLTGIVVAVLLGAVGTFLAGAVTELLTGSTTAGNWAAGLLGLPLGLTYGWILGRRTARRFPRGIGTLCGLIAGAVVGAIPGYLLVGLGAMIWRRSSQPEVFALTPFDILAILAWLVGVPLGTIFGAVIGFGRGRSFLQQADRDRAEATAGKIRTEANPAPGE